MASRRRAPAHTVKKPLKGNPKKFRKLKRVIDARSVPLPVLPVVDIPRRDADVGGDLNDTEFGGDPGLTEPGTTTLARTVTDPAHAPHTYSSIRSFPGMQAQSADLEVTAEFRVTGGFELAEFSAVPTFRDRLLWAIKFRETNQLQLALKAGFKSPAHVNRILKRAERNPNAQVEVRTATRLARALDISLHWLQTGEGAKYPFEPYFNLDDPFPNRQRAAWAHALVGTDSRAIADVVGRDWGDAKDPTAKVWFKRIELAEEQLLRGD